MCAVKVTSPPSIVSALPVVNHGQIASLCASARAGQVSTKTKRMQVFIVLRDLGPRRFEGVGIHNLPALLQDVEPVDIEITELVDLAAEPANLDAIDLLRLVQSEMQAHIVLGEV